MELRILWYLAWLLSGKRFSRLSQQILSVVLAFSAPKRGVAAVKYKEKSYEYPKKSYDKIDNIGSMGNFGIDIEVANLVRCYNKQGRLVLAAILRSG